MNEENSALWESIDKAVSGYIPVYELFEKAYGPIFAPEPWLTSENIRGQIDIVLSLSSSLEIGQPGSQIQADVDSLRGWEVPDGIGCPLIMFSPKLLLMLSEFGDVIKNAFDNKQLLSIMAMHRQVSYTGEIEAASKQYDFFKISEILTDVRIDFIDCVVQTAVFLRIVHDSPPLNK